MMTGSREAELIEAANLLLDARRTMTPIVDLPVELRPKTLDEAYVVNGAMAVAYDEVGGWKIGAPGPDAFTVSGRSALATAIGTEPGPSSTAPEPSVLKVASSLRSSEPPRLAGRK